MALRASHASGVFLVVAFPEAGALRSPILPLEINGVASQDMSLAETQQLIERTEGILTLLILRDQRQFLVNIPDIDSQSDSSRMDGEDTRVGQGQTQHRGCTLTDASPLLLLQISQTSTLTCPVPHLQKPPHDLELLPGQIHHRKAPTVPMIPSVPWQILLCSPFLSQYPWRWYCHSQLALLSPLPT